MKLTRPAASVEITASPMLRNVMRKRASASRSEPSASSRSASNRLTIRAARQMNRLKRKTPASTSSPVPKACSYNPRRSPINRNQPSSMNNRIACGKTRRNNTPPGLALASIAANGRRGRAAIRPAHNTTKAAAVCIAISVAELIRIR
ncbi:MAG: hypothetical protein JMDDDDMK_02265 [Acidobacteria bacterium]|nr:hypothetical protein [Acidobacteriota bacterium]